MTVQELIEKLQRADPDAVVMVPGEEYDWTENLEAYYEPHRRIFRIEAT